MIITLLITSLGAAPWKHQQDSGFYCKTRLPRPDYWLNLQHGVNTKNPLQKRLRSSELVFNLGFSWKTQTWSLFVNPKCVRFILISWKSSGCEKSEILILLGFNLSHFQLHIVRGDGRTRLARNDSTEARRAWDPSWWTWTGISRWETSLDETFQPNPVLLEATTRQRRLQWKLIK